MTREEKDNIKVQMRKGVLELCVLRYLIRGEAYPSDIIKALGEAGFSVVEGTIYTLLNRLRRDGKLGYKWYESTQGPPRKYFYLTESGLESLQVMNEAWAEIERTVKHFADTYEEDI